MASRCDLRRYLHRRGKLKVIAVVLESPVIERIIMHIGLQVRALPRAPPDGQISPERASPS